MSGNHKAFTAPRCGSGIARGKLHHPVLYAQCVMPGPDTAAGQCCSFGVRVWLAHKAGAELEGGEVTEEGRSRRRERGRRRQAAQGSLHESPVYCKQPYAVSATLPCYALARPCPVLTAGMVLPAVCARSHSRCAWSLLRQRPLPLLSLPILPLYGLPLHYLPTLSPNAISLHIISLHYLPMPSPYRRYLPTLHMPMLTQYAAFLHPEIKYKKPRFQYTVYQQCGPLSELPTRAISLCYLPTPCPCQLLPLLPDYALARPCPVLTWRMEVLVAYDGCRVWQYCRGCWSCDVPQSAALSAYEGAMRCAVLRYRMQAWEPKSVLHYGATFGAGHVPYPPMVTSPTLLWSRSLSPYGVGMRHRAYAIREVWPDARPKVLPFCYAKSGTAIPDLT
eukprot:3616505-Rhodomonas_salina.3